MTLGLRAKLALVALALLALPWAGVLYVNEMERTLLAGQERALIGAARGVATRTPWTPFTPCGWSGTS